MVPDLMEALSPLDEGPVTGSLPWKTRTRVGEETLLYRQWPMTSAGQLAQRHPRRYSASATTAIPGAEGWNCLPRKTRSTLKTRKA